MIYEFGEFQLDPLRRVVSSRAAVQPLPVTGRVFDTLLYFIEHQGELLDKRTLMQAVWSDVVVEESNLTQTIHTLRRLLGERPEEHRFIVTVPGRGYRFVCPVMRHMPAVPEPQPLAPSPKLAAAPLYKRRRVVLGALSLAVLGIALALFSSRAWQAAPPAPSIAVLPFVDMSPEHDAEYLGDGLSEEILNVLAQSSSLRVIARTSSFSFKGEKADIARIAATLNVTHVLEGSVRKSAGRIRITAQLVDGTTSAHIWSQTYDRDAADVLELQTDIAAAVADSLHVSLGHDDAPNRGETRSAQAFELYLHGRYFFNRRGPADVARATELFEHAVQIDPGYARAWAGLAGALFVADHPNKRIPPHTMTKWREAVERAVTLGPNLTEAHVRAAQYHWVTGDARAANEHLERAMALNPSDPLVLGTSARPNGDEKRLREQIARLRRAAAVDPLSALVRQNLGVFLAATGQWDAAIDELRAALDLSPASLYLHAEIARIQILQERFEEAFASAALVPEGTQRDQCLALIYHATGREDTSGAMARLIEVAQTPGSDAAVKLAIAEVYAFHKNNDAAFEWLTRADHQTRDNRAVVPGWWLSQEAQVSPFLRPLHADQRWRTLLTSASTR